MYAAFSFCVLVAGALLSQLEYSGATEIGKSTGNLMPKSTVGLKVQAEFRIGEKSLVKVQILDMKSETSSLMKRQANLTTPAPSTNFTTVDLTPAECNHKQCYPGGFERPTPSDCDVVWAAQAYNSTGSLTAYPGTMVYVSYQTCAVVFQNPDRDTNPYAIQFNWAKLGAVGQAIAGDCFPPKKNSIGGVCQYDSYLKYKFNDVLISTQKHLQP